MKRVFLIGHPVGHSISPLMQDAAFRALEMDWRYETLEAAREELPDVIARLRADDCAGANVTVPHKEEIIPLLDGLGESAQKIGAVNTIVKRDHKLIGENTDGYGFKQTLGNANFDVSGQRVVIFGAGGAARAIAVATAELGATCILIQNRTRARAEILAAFLRERFSNLIVIVNSKEIANTNLIVNATSLGMWPRVDKTPMPSEFPRGAVAFDLVYRPMQTRFLREAARAGAQTIGGVGMLVHQGAAAFRLWTGRDAPVDKMFDAARHALNGV